ncbi:MAG: hypothetical protein ACWGQW_19500 [bacterium]
MYAWGDDELPEEEIEKVLTATAKKIHSLGMDLIAILALESVKPLSNIGGELSRMIFSPFLPALGPEYNMMGDKLIYVFQRRENVEKLIKILEEYNKKEEKKEEKQEPATEQPEEDA